MITSKPNTGFEKGKYVVFSGIKNSSDIEKVLGDKKKYTIVKIDDDPSDIEDTILVAIGKQKTPILFGIDTKEMSLQLRGLISAGLILVNPNDPIGML